MTKDVSQTKRAQILLVEDDPGDQELTRRALLRDRILADVHVVTDGEQAMDYLCRVGRYEEPASSPRPDLILLDLNLPGMLGKEVLEEIRKHHEFRRTPVVVVSTSAREVDVADAYAMGCNSYLIKPLEAERYMKALRQIYSYWFELITLPPASP